MVYGKRSYISGALERLNSVKPLWDLLRRLPAAEWGGTPGRAALHRRPKHWALWEAT